MMDVREAAPQPPRRLAAEDEYRDPASGRLLSVLPSWYERNLDHIAAKARERRHARERARQVNGLDRLFHGGRSKRKMAPFPVPSKFALLWGDNQRVGGSYGPPATLSMPAFGATVENGYKTRFCHPRVAAGGNSRCTRR